MKLVFSSHPYYDNRYDMSWEEEHVCILCDGNGCRACNPPPTEVRVPIVKPVAPEAPKKYWEIEEEKYRERKAELMREEMPWIISLIQKDKRR